MPPIDSSLDRESAADSGLGGRARAALIPGNTPVATPGIVVDDMVVSEADDYVDIVVQLTAPGTSTVSVKYATQNGTALGNYDVRGASGTLTFAPGETSKTVRVDLLGDSAAENLEFFRFNLSSPTNASLAKATAMVSIVDNDTLVDTPRLFVRDTVIDEKAGTASFVVMLGGPKGQVSNGTVTVDYATADDTAQAGSDYLAKTGTLAFAPGETVKTIVVDITDDSSAEGLERFALELSNATNATIADGSGLGLIGPNDGTAVQQPRISVDDVVVGEGDGYLDVVVSLSAPGQNTVTVNYQSANGSAIGNYDAVGVSGTITFAPGETTKFVRVQLLDETGVNGVEKLEHFRFNLSGPTNATLAKATAMVSIVDNDTVVDTPTLFVRDAVIDEKAGTASFVVMLGGPKGQVSNSTVTVDYATADRTAETGSDYTAQTGTLTFAPGETVKTVVVDITDDSSAEGLERFALNLSNASNATILDGTGLGIIAPSDATPTAQPRISVDDVVVGEGDGYVDLVVSLSAPGQNVVSVNYQSANGSAVGNYDVEGVSGTVTFAPGETTRVVRVELLDDTGRENLENFRLNLSSPTNATLAKATAMVSIVDNDTVVDTPRLFVRDALIDEKAGTASFAVMLGGPRGEVSGSTVTVKYATADSTATAGSDYTAQTGTLTFAPGETVKTVVVDITDDSNAEGLERFALNLSNATNATILDGTGLGIIGPNDATPTAQPRISVDDVVVGEGDGYVDLVVNLSAPGQSAVTVNYQSANGSAVGNYDAVGVGGTITFAPGETTKSIRIELLDDTGVNAVETLEHFRFNLSNPTNATLAKATAMVSIVDNDSVVDMPQLLVRDAVIDEKAGTASFVVMLGGPQGEVSNSNVTVKYATANGTALAGSDYAAATGTLTFAPGETVKTVVLDIRDDDLAEGAERFVMKLSNAVNATIVDNVAAGVIGASDNVATVSPIISVPTWTVAEDDGYVDLLVSLGAPSQSTVTVNYATANGSAVGNYDVRGVTGTLTFAPGETTRVVRMEIMDDTGPESTESFTFNLSAPVNATIGNSSTVISIVDNDNGVDVFSHGVSDDVYTVDAASDVIVENIDGGTDKVLSSIDYTLGSHLENLTLTGAAIRGVGNSLVNVILGNNGANVLEGDAGDDTLDGAGGADSMSGGTGNDTYRVNAAGDVVTELAGQGIDTVISTFNHTLRVNVENLVLGGTAANGNGNTASNRITGNVEDNRLSGAGGADTLLGGAGSDTLVGGGGKDVLTGGADADAFRLDSALGPVDRINDFTPGIDRVELDDDVFSAFVAGVAITGDQFRSGAGVTSAQDSDDRLMYNTTTGSLYYDPDGEGGANNQLVAVFGTTTHPELTVADFSVIA